MGTPGRQGKRAFYRARGRPGFIDIPQRCSMAAGAIGRGSRRLAQYPCAIAPCVPPMPAHSRFPPPTAVSLFVLLGLLQSLIWMALAFYLSTQCSWMALVLAVTAALSLRLCGMPAGRPRMLWAAGLTAIGVAWTSWGIVVLQMGVTMGVRPQDSAVKLGWHLARTLLLLANTPLDYALLALAVAGAAIASR